MKVEITPSAACDLDDIGDRIAQRNPKRAATYVREIRDKALLLVDFPHSGAPRPAWGADVRVAIHGNYLIVYRVRGEVVQVLRVVHGARDLEALFARQPLPQ